jgi:hypothetical protein
LFSGVLVFTRLAGLVALLGAAGVSAKPSGPPGLFSPEWGTSLPALPQQAIAGKSRAVTLNYAALHDGLIAVNLPGGVAFDAVRDEIQELGDGRFAWVGHAGDDPANLVVIGVSGQSVAGSFFYDGRLFKLEPRAQGRHVLSEVEPTDPAPELDPLLVDDASLSADSSQGTQSLSQDSTAGSGTGASVIDVLVVYTPAVEALYGGASGADALIVQAAAEANKAYSYSKMTTRLNLVHTALTNYVESGSMSTDANRLRGTSDGYMDEIHALRDSYGADVVSLIENNAQYCGVGYLMDRLSASFAAYAFSVVHHGCATGYFSFAHEIGHNQGANHDAAHADTASIYSYAYGYQEAHNTFRTVMAYDCPGGCPRWPVFSRGDNPLLGLPTGYTGVSENAVAIDQTASTVAAFRQSLTQLPPGAIADLSAAGITTSRIDLEWTDTLNDEDNYYVERSGDGVIFTEIATLPADSSGYSDTGLAQDVLYSYRIRTSNSSGYSPYSNVALAATAYRPPGCD